MTAPRLDPTSIAGKRFTVRPHVPLVVVGAGPAGLAAATEAAKRGVRTMLVDENPIDAGLMGMDVPYFFGGRMDASVQNGQRLVERLLEQRPALAEAYEQGIEVQLGVCAWGAYGNGPTAQAFARPILGLSDGAQSWLQSFDSLIVAAGARDLALAFPGWDRPGVMGARAFQALLGDYGAFAGRRIAVLGGGYLALSTAAAALDRGLEVAGVATVDGAPAGPTDLLDRLRRAQVPIHARHAIQQTLGRAEVEGLRLAPLGGGIGVDLACDTIVQAIDLVPNVELLDVLGCAMAYRPDQGGFVPRVDAEGRTSLSHVFAAGDCTGSDEAAPGEPARAEAQGKRAAMAAARLLGAALDAAEPVAPVLASSALDREGLRQRWQAAHLEAGGDELVICQCEEVRVRDLLGVRPPRYLRYDEARLATRNLHGLAVEGPVNQDQVKRLTRSGMGACQGRRCRDQVHLLLAQRGNVTPVEIPMASYRAPVRPVPLGVLADRDEAPEIRQHWTAWYGIPAQWQPHWKPPEDKPAEGSGGLFAAEK